MRVLTFGSSALRCVRCLWCVFVVGANLARNTTRSRPAHSGDIRNVFTPKRLEVYSLARVEKQARWVNAIVIPERLKVQSRVGARTTDRRRGRKERTPTHSYPTNLRIFSPHTTNTHLKGSSRCLQHSPNSRRCVRISAVILLSRGWPSFTLDYDMHTILGTQS
jgi:hypothetical protein